MRTPKEVIQLLNEKLTPALQKKVGNLFFGDNPEVVKLQKAHPPGEINTTWEDGLEDKIRLWMSNSTDELAKYFKKNKELLKTLSKEFPTVLQPPIGKPVYRGTSIKTDSLKDAFMRKQYKIVKVAGKEVFYFTRLGYKPNRESQSWTTDPKIAFKFDGNSDNSELVHVVYVDKVNNKDHIFSPELMNILYDISSTSGESEVIRVGGEGIFKAFVESRVFLRTWSFKPKDNFIHKLSQAKPFFKTMVVKYNKKAAKWNKDYPKETVPLFTTADDLITAYYDDDLFLQDSIPFSLGLEYRKAVEKFIKSVKSK